MVEKSGSLGLKRPELKCSLTSRDDISTPAFSSPYFSTLDFSSPWFKNSRLKSSGLKSLGLKLGAEKFRVEMSFNQKLTTMHLYPLKVNFHSVFLPSLSLMIQVYFPLPVLEKTYLDGQIYIWEPLGKGSLSRGNLYSASSSYLHSVDMENSPHHSVIFIPCSQDLKANLYL